MWMGGFVPVGYQKRDRSLTIDEVEAETVRWIFQRYNQLKSVRLLKEDLDRRGLVSKIRIGKHGGRMGGKEYSRGKLYKLLANPIYVGEIRHLQTSHPGLHEAIIDRDIWNRTQQLLAQQAVRRPEATGSGNTNASPLARKLIDETGQALTPTHALKNGRRHRYYVSRGLLIEGAQARTTSGGWRLPAREIEQAVATAAATMLEDKSALVTAIQECGFEADRISAILDQAYDWRQQLKSDLQGEALPALVDRVVLTADGFTLTLGVPTSRGPSSATLTLERFIPLKMKRRGVELRLVVGNEPCSATKVDRALMKTIARAHQWFEQLVSGEVKSLAELAAREGVHYRFVGKVIRLAFLAPEILERIAEGRQPLELTTELLTKRLQLPIDWDDQRQLLGFNPA
jgi:site-specific DNA recombinase